MAIGIFDSGMGGLSVLAFAKKMLPYEDFIYYGDSANAPYGTKTKEEVIELSIRIVDYLIKRGVKAVVVACNTATSAAIDTLREMYDIPIIGMEPALKPAIERNQGGDIVVMATPMTLNEDKFQQLFSKMKTERCIYEVAAPKIVGLVEEGVVDGHVMQQVIETYFKYIPKGQIESVVLGCTHFVFVKSVIRDLFSQKVNLIDGNFGTINQLIRKLRDNNLLSMNNDYRKIEFINSKK